MSFFDSVVRERVFSRLQLEQGCTIVGLLWEKTTTFPCKTSIFAESGATMFEARRKSSWIGSLGRVLELIFHNTVRSVRKTHANAFMAIGLNILQTVILVASFYILFTVLGMRSSAIRGDFILFIMSGIFLYMLHVRAVQAVFSTEGPSAPMMLHAPMTTFVAITSNALAALYTQLLSMVLVLYFYHVIFEPIEIHNWKGALGMVCLAWFSGVGVGILFLGLKPWFPSGASTAPMRTSGSW